MIGNIDLELNDYKIYSYQAPLADHCLITTVRLLTPSVHLFQYKRDVWVEWYRELGVRAPTTFIFHKSEHFWSLTVSFLGFGLGLAHQNGY